MKIKSANWIYIAAITPLLVVDFALGMWLARNKMWLVILLAVFCVAAVAWVFRKFQMMPKSMDTYGEYYKADLELPVDANVELYWAEGMGQFEFLHRVVEIVTPLLPKKGEPFMLMMNPKMMEYHGEKFMKIAVTRELKSVRTYTSMRSMLGLVLPFEALAAGLLLVANFHLQLEQVIGGFWINMVGPFVVVALFGLCLFFWNKRISKDDCRLDRYLLAHFSKEEVEEYICISEKMLEGGKKEKEFSEHYKNDRINALRYDLYK